MCSSVSKGMPVVFQVREQWPRRPEMCSEFVKMKELVTPATTTIAK